MVKLQIGHWFERWRTMLAKLAIPLPAMVLIGGVIVHLRTIQREDLLEAVIQRDYQQVLAVAQKRIVETAYENAEKP